MRSAPGCRSAASRRRSRPSAFPRAWPRRSAWRGRRCARWRSRSWPRPRSGPAIWIAQTLRDPAPARGDRSPALALAENSLYAVEHGVNFLALGTLSAFDASNGQVAIPVDSREDVFDESDAGTIRIFSYRDAITAPLFIPLLLVLIALPAGAALLAGFGVARLRAAGTPVQAVAWGAIVGPLWAVVGALVAAIAAREVIFGAVSGGSLFGFLLLGGAVLGGARRLPRAHPLASPERGRAPA